LQLQCAEPQGPDSKLFLIKHIIGGKKKAEPNYVVLHAGCFCGKEARRRAAGSSCAHGQQHSKLSRGSQPICEAEADGSDDEGVK
jgi:hypothetical protein